MITWQQELTIYVLLHQIIENQNQALFDDLVKGYPYLKNTLSLMKSLFIIEDDDSAIIVTDKGRDVYQGLLLMQDEISCFDIFAHVNLGLELTKDVSDDGAFVHDLRHDPRYVLPCGEEEIEAWGTEDIRLAVISFLSHYYSVINKKKKKEEIPVELSRIVFLQMLANEQMDSREILADFDSGTIFLDINNIVSNSTKWQEMADDEEEAMLIMQTIFSSGFIEQQKRQGKKCRICETPLARFYKNNSLDKCPKCLVKLVHEKEGNVDDSSSNYNPNDPLDNIESFAILSHKFI